jgi:hypothetical protein
VSIFAALLVVVFLEACSFVEPPSSIVVATPTHATGTASTRDLAQPAIQYVEAHPSDFGGAYVDQTGFAVHILYTGTEDQAKTALEGRLPAGLVVVWQPVRHSSAQLKAVQAEILDLWRTLEPGRIVAVSVDVVRNRVVVGTSQADSELVGQLETKYGDAVQVEVQAPDGPA